jgi:hypothetical protein
MKTTVQKFKALLKARKNSDIENILKKCSLDEMRKIACVLKTNTEIEFPLVFAVLIIDALYKRRIDREYAFDRKKVLATLVF